MTGKMAGYLNAGYHKGANVKSTTKSGDDIWEHNAENFEGLWREASKEMGQKWSIRAWFWRFGIHSGLGMEGGLGKRGMGLLRLLLPSFEAVEASKKHAHSTMIDFRTIGSQLIRLINQQKVSFLASSSLLPQARNHETTTKPSSQSRSCVLDISPTLLHRHATDLYAY